MSSAAPMFETPAFTVRELAAAELPRLQALFDANPEYFVTVNGRPPWPDEARQEFDELPPPHLSYGRRWFAGVFDRAGALQGTAIVVSNLVLPGAWQLALLLMATSLHGRGAAVEVYAGLERWARLQGAVWLRLGVVVGNARAERFWQRAGFVQMRTRDGVDTGGRINDVRILLKPLAAVSVDDYLRQVPRDRPASELP